MITWLKPVVVAVAAAIVYLLLSGNTIEKDTKSSENFPFNNIKHIQDGLDEIPSSAGITDVNPNKPPLRFEAPNYQSIAILELKQDEWSSKLSSIVASNQPTKFTTTPAVTWKALQWDMEVLSDTWPVLNNVMMTEKGGLQFLYQV